MTVPTIKYRHESSRNMNKSELEPIPQKMIDYLNQIQYKLLPDQVSKIKTILSVSSQFYSRIITIIL